MSAPPAPTSNDAGPPHAQRRGCMTAFLILSGIVLLLPGLCSVVAIAIGIWEWLSGQAELARIGVWTIGLVVGAFGVVLIYAARANAKKGG